MRLIDADAIKGTFANGENYTGREVIALLNQQPTAYDLDKVIEQAEINLKAACRRYDECTAATLPVLYAEYRTQYKERKICLEIIKSGICQKGGSTDDE